MRCGICLAYALGAYMVGMATPWLTPHLTVGHVVFALATLVHIATPFEEADLIDELGEDYRRYRARAPAFLPGRRSKPTIRE